MPKNLALGTFRLVLIIWLFLFSIGLLYFEFALKRIRKKSLFNSKKILTKLYIDTLGIKIKCNIPIPSGQFIIISNHKSYIDPLIILHFVDCIPLAKIEVSKWPLIGFTLKLFGVLFVERNNLSSRKNATDLIKNHIYNGYSILIFPEGTTSNFSKTLPFKNGPFIISTKTNCPILPVAISYKEKNDSWIGKQNFVEHFINCFSKRNTPVNITFGEPIHATDPLQLKEICKDWIDKKLHMAEG